MLCKHEFDLCMTWIKQNCKWKKKKNVPCENVCVPENAMFKEVKKQEMRTEEDMR